MIGRGNMAIEKILYEAAVALAEKDIPLDGEELQPYIPRMDKF